MILEANRISFAFENDSCLSADLCRDVEKLYLIAAVSRLKCGTCQSG